MIPPSSGLTIGARKPLSTPPLTLFTVPGLPTMGFYDEPFDVTPDGRRFLLKVIGERAGSSRAVLLTNWPARLKK